MAVVELQQCPGTRYYAFAIESKFVIMNFGPETAKSLELKARWVAQMEFDRKLVAAYRMFRGVCACHNPDCKREGCTCGAPTVAHNVGPNPDGIHAIKIDTLHMPGTSFWAVRKYYDPPPKFVVDCACAPPTPH